MASFSSSQVGRRPGSTQDGIDQAYNRIPYDLASLRAYYDGPLSGITVDTIRGYFATTPRSAPRRAQEQAVLASFLSRAYRQELVDADPMGKIGGAVGQNVGRRDRAWRRRRQGR